MISAEQAVKNVEDLDTPYIRIYDWKGNQLYAIDCTKNAPEAANRLKEILPVFSGYAKVIVHAATEKQFAGTWKSCSKWEVKVGTDTVSTAGNNAMMMQQQNPMNQMMQTFQFMQMCQGMFQPQQNAQIEMLRKEFEWEREKSRLENADPIKKYSALAPFLGRALGWKPEEMKEMFQMSAMTSTWGNSTQQPLQQQNQQQWQPLQQNNKTAGVQQQTQTTLVTEGLPIPTFDQLQKLSVEEKFEQINLMLDKLATERKVCAEDMLIMLYLMYNKPELVPKALTLYNSGMI